VSQAGYDGFWVPLLPGAGMSVPLRVSWRQIEEADVAGVVDLLARGFPVRDHAYWQRAFARLRDHRGPPDLPQFGYLLQCGGTPVGVVLTIGSVRPLGEKPAVLCNLSSWYVEPAFRAYAPLLISAALRHRGVTFANVSPAPHTVPIVQVQGFTRHSDGQFVAVPTLAPAPGVEVRLQQGDETPAAPCDPLELELELMRAHRAFGCIAIWAVRKVGPTHHITIFSCGINRSADRAAREARCGQFAQVIRRFPGFRVTPKGRAPGPAE
jgi:hypothetical protein